MLALIRAGSRRFGEVTQTQFSKCWVKVSATPEDDVICTGMLVASVILVLVACPGNTETSGVISSKDGLSCSACSAVLGQLSMSQARGQAVKAKEYVGIELRETSSSMDRSYCLKEAIGPSPNLIQEPSRFSYLPVSVSHSWGSLLYSRDRVCSLFVVALNLQQKSTGMSQQLWAPAPSSTQCPLPQDSLMQMRCPFL